MLFCCFLISSDVVYFQWDFSSLLFSPLFSPNVVLGQNWKYYPVLI